MTMDQDLFAGEADVALSRNSPPLPEGFSYRLDLSSMATSRDLQSAPRHRWFYFLHSYSYRLVEHILDKWKLPEDALLVDNFVGSGTTLTVAKDRGVAALGYDLSPLAVTVANVKTASYSVPDLRDGFCQILNYQPETLCTEDMPKRLRDAFSEKELMELSKFLKLRVTCQTQYVIFSR